MRKKNIAPYERMAEFSSSYAYIYTVEDWDNKKKKTPYPSNQTFWENEPISTSQATLTSTTPIKTFCLTMEEQYYMGDFIGIADQITAMRLGLIPYEKY